LSRVSPNSLRWSPPQKKNDGAVRSALNDNVVATFADTAGALHAVAAGQQIQRDFNAIEEG
jgi:hypothetical protein